MPVRVAFGRGQQQRAQSGEAVGGDAAGGDQLTQGVFQFRAQQVHGAHQLVEEQRAVLAQGIGHRLCARGKQQFLRLAWR